MNEFLGSGHMHMKAMHAKGRFTNLLSHVIFLRISLPKIQISGWNFDCILIVHNDHVNELAKIVPIDICYVHKSNYGKFSYKGISNL
jgi:hypothetical protein